MALVSKNIPNLINGVSQQPPALRLASQGDAQENGLSDIVDGLKKRPPTQLKNKLKKTDPTGVSYLSTAEINRSHFHTYKRSTSEQYTVVTDPVTPKMYVYDIDGKLRYEAGVASWDATGTQINTNTDNIPLAYYLGNDLITSDRLAATSVADYTFFVNKEKVVAKNTSAPSNVRPWEGMFYAKKLDYSKENWFKVRDSSGTLIEEGGIATRDGGGSDAPNEALGLQTGRSMDLLAGYSDNPNGDATYNSYYALKDITLGTIDLEKARNSNDPFVVLRTDTSTANDFEIDVTDDNGGTNCFAFKDTVSTFTELPKFCVDGFTIQVNGDNQKKEDDFYVEFKGSNSAGTWKECAAPSRPNTPVYHTFDTSTMPHTLSQNADLSFTFGTSTWDDRKCGDDDTNPFPSFVGSKINDVFFHRNRLGFLSDENVIFSEASSYFNFFRVTVRSLLDSAPIDLAVSQNEVSILKAAVPAQDDLILFSDLTQFTLSADSLLTPSEVIIDQSTKYECNLTSTPVGAGTSVFFTTKSGNYSGVREFFTKDDSENKDAPSVTAHVPEYLEGTVRQMIASSNEDMLVCLTESNKKECYIYKWYNSNQERIQSSWSKWVFAKDIAHIFFNNANLTIIFSDGSFELLSLSPVSESVSYEETSQTSAQGTSGTYNTTNMGYAHTYKGYYPNVGNIGTSSNVLLQQAYVQQTEYTGSPDTFRVKVRALKTMFVGSSAFAPEFLPNSLKITNNANGYVLTKDVYASVPVGTQQFSANYTSQSSYVDFELTIDSATYNSLFTGAFVIDFIYATTTVSVQSDTNIVHLDHRKVLTGVLNTVALLAEYTPTANTQYVDHKGNLIATGTPSDGDDIFTYLAGTHTTDQGTVNNYVYAGEVYNFKYQLSEQVFKAGEKDPTRLARYQLRGISFNYNDTGSFKVTVSSTGRDDKVTNFTGRILGQSNNLLGYSPAVEDGTLKVGIQSQAQETTITINNDSHLPSTFQNAEVEAFVTLRNKRM